MTRGPASPSRGQVPAHVLADPPPAALEWAARAAGGNARVIRVRALRRGRAHANHVITLQPAGGKPYELVLRRWARPGWERDEPNFDARREASVLTLLATSDVPAPRLVAVDAHASHADVPAVLMNMLPGAAPRRGLAANILATELATALAGVHAVGVTRDAVPTYWPRLDAAGARPPEWWPNRQQWGRLTALAAGARSTATHAFIHGEYHADNTLWVGARLSGIVDWSAGALGPRGIDVARARWHLVATRGPRVADVFLSEYAARAPGGYVHDVAWDAVVAVDRLARGASDEAPPPATHRRRLSSYVTSLLS